MENWFTIEQLEADTFAISEYRHWEQTHCYLLVGTRRALLIDTGLGVGDLRAEVDRLTGLPVTVLSTHVHWDHIGGHRQFARHLVHPSEAAWLNGAFPLPKAAVIAMLQRDCALPEEFDPQSYSIFQGSPSELVDDGDRLDLGGRMLTVLHTPGHAPGHLCVWEQARGALYSGDLVYRGTLYANYPSTDPQALLRSMETVAALPIQRIFPGHHSLALPADLPRRMAAALRALDRRGLLRHGSGLFSYEDWAVSL